MKPLQNICFQLLRSDKSNNELQGELIDLLGFEQFEMVGKVLDARYQLVDELKSARQDAANLSKYMPEKLVPLRNDGPIYCQQVLVQTKAEADMRREIRKEQKRAKKELNRIQHAFGDEEKLELELAQREILRMRQLEMDQLKWTPSIKSVSRPREVYPYVFDACVDTGSAMITINGMKYALPEGSTRESFRTHGEVEVPPINRGSVEDVQHVFVKDMDDLGQLGFQGFEKLNVIQSIVFEQAYKTRENLLICAPTGAGKTNIAMLTILNTIHAHRMLNGEIAKDDFKIIYIAPMKALATEMTESFGKRLAPLGLKVRELTGDTVLTKREVAETQVLLTTIFFSLKKYQREKKVEFQMLVLTPEKWDVVTRKGAADSSLTSLVRLLIIDEVHLLHDDRGPVIETIVARTLRQVEMSQTGIRIVGLSATLPNYVDVARFLRVNLYKGLFYFDGRFRPVPLTQKFIGIKKIGGVRDVQETMNEVCYDEVLKFVKKGHQVLVFVHARNATASLAQAFRERAAQLVSLPVSLGPFMPDDMVLALISMAKEFSQLKIREEECLDLEELISCGCVLPLRGGGLASVSGKVNVLLQSHISRAFVRSFSLASESLYVQQNAGRLCRAMFEIVLRKGWAQAANAFLTMSKSIEKRVWPNQSSLRQLDEFLRVDLIEKVERRKLTESQLLDLSAKELGYMFSCDGDKLHQTMRMLPRVEVDAVLKPITYTIVQVSAILTPAFIWNDRLLGKNGAQSFWLTLENIDENFIVHQERIAINKKKVRSREPQNLVFTIPIRDHQLTNVFQLRVASEYFLVDDTVVALSMHNCILPKSYKAHTDLLPLDPLPVKTIRNEKFESIYNFPYFNPIQTQVFHCLYQTDENVLIGAPTGSGKTLCAELAIFRLLQKYPEKKCVYIAPLKALVRERVSDWREKFEKKLGYKVVEVSGDYTPDVAVLNEAPIIITTPEKWDGITRSWATREYVRQVNLIIIDEIHLLGVDRGAVLEAIITRLKLLTKRSYVRETCARLLGLSTALANAGDVAEWLGIRDAGLFNFRPSVRPVPVEVHIQGFPGQHYCPRMALMNKPAFKAIITYSPIKPVLVFVASRRQTRLTAMAFISHLVTESDPRQWLHIDMAEVALTYFTAGITMTDTMLLQLEVLLQSVKDENLKLTLPFGIGMHHAGLSPHERALVEQLYVEKKIQVLIATATLAWGINMPAHLVIVKGTEYYDGKTCKYIDFPVTDVLQMMGRAGRPQFDTSAVAVIYVQDIKKTFYKRFLYEPFPVESSLLPVLANHVNAEINAGTITSKQGIMEYLAGTYLYRRLFANPNYYGLEDLTEKSLIKYLVGVVDQCVADLLSSKCIIIDEEMGDLRASPFGRIASINYLRHETMKFLTEELGPENSIEDLLKTLSHVPEYGEIPVRHNEDVVNTQLQRKLRIRFATSVMDSSHTKAHLLFQAHFSRTEIPTDYRTDLKSVLDQCVRILQAMRDVCQLNGWLSTVLRITILQQMCYSGRWHDDHPLLCLPHLKSYDAENIGDRATIPLLQNQFDVEKASGSDIVEKRAKNFLLESTTLEEMEIKEVVRALCRWPILSVGGLQLCKGTEKFRIEDEWLQLQRNTHYKLQFHINMLGPNRFNTEAFLTQWSKEKTASWIVIIGEKDIDRLTSITHVSAVQGDRSVRIDFVTPDKGGRCYITVFIMSDCHLGIDQELQIKADLS
ncbi:hypothetical protein NECAME_08767 [Necator americanus]|uniref:Sec63 domain protein n=1 Tax=Necator americanus TaxID=51031 RepID=W2TG90_NECAM|nr:hypothetical protein NECAME_08767 [Necator americanus]ETN81065.1 hypothetical protein NECAME_08767 [Necator americanus]